MKKDIIVDIPFGNGHIRFENISSKQLEVLNTLSENYQLSCNRRGAIIDENKLSSVESAAIKYAKNNGMMAYVFPDKLEGFIAGAYSEEAKEFHNKKMYSKEDIINAIHQLELKQNRSHSKFWDELEPFIDGIKK